MDVRNVLKERFFPLIDSLGPYENCPNIAVAVSGGPDSLALTYMLYEWVCARGGRLTALHVDHRLRPGSLSDADWVKSELSTLHRCHVAVLVREGERPKSRIQEAARIARYQLLTDYCRARGIVHLFLAHHWQDQQETVALRAGKTSTAYGLAGMSAVMDLDGVRLLRPMLLTDKDELHQVLTEKEINWIDDDSNRNPVFARTRLRASQAATGYTKDRLYAVGKARMAFGQSVARAMVRHVELHPGGYLTIAHWREIDRSARAALFGFLARALGGGYFRVTPERIDAMIKRLAANDRTTQRAKIATLGHCQWFLRKDALVIAKEASACETRVVKNIDQCYWDKRFSCIVEAKGHKLAIGPLGQSGVAKLSTERALKTIPAIARAALPALWADGELVSVPALSWGGGLKTALKLKKNALAPEVFGLALPPVTTM